MPAAKGRWYHPGYGRTRSGRATYVRPSVREGRSARAVCLGSGRARVFGGRPRRRDEVLVAGPPVRCGGTRHPGGGARLGPEKGCCGWSTRAERELLAVLREHGELTPTAAAMLTPLTAAEAAEMLERLAREEHLEARVGDGAIAYALRERDRLALSETPRKTADGDDPAEATPVEPLEDPLSSRELAVLELLADGCTNREIAQGFSSPWGPSKPTWRASTASSMSTPAPRQSPGRETSTSSNSPNVHQGSFRSKQP